MGKFSVYVGWIGRWASREMSANVLMTKSDNWKELQEDSSDD